MSNPRVRKTERFLAILLTLVMVIGMLPISAYASSTDFPDKFTVTVKDSEGTPVADAKVTYTLKVDGEAKVSDQETDNPTNSNGAVAIDLSAYEADISGDSNVTITVTASKEPLFTEKTETDKTVSSITDNIDITLTGRTVTVTGTVNDHEGAAVDGATVAFSGDNVDAKSAATGADGSFTLLDVPVCENGVLTITAPASLSDKYNALTYAIPFSAAPTVSCGALTFKLKTYKVTFVSNGFGKFTLTDSGDAITELSVKHGDDISFKFVPNDGFEATVTDGSTQLTDQSGVYTISNVQAAHTIAAATEDIQAPKIKSVSVEDAAIWAKEKSINVEYDDNAGQEQVRIYISLTEYANYDELAASGESEVSLPHKVGANGTYYVYAVDTANLFATDSINVTTVDIAAPTIDGFTPIPQGPSATPRYEFTVTDDQSGVASVRYYKLGDEDNKKDATADGSIGKYYFIADENTDYYVIVTDNAGNTRTYNTKVENYDGDAPVITAVNASDKWSASENTVSFTANDNFSIKKLYYATSFYEKLEDLESASDITAIDVSIENNGNGSYSFSVTENGTYYIYAVDDTDHISYESVDVNYIDKTAPTVDKIEKDPDVEWHNNTVTISGSVSDNQTTGNTDGSGVVSVVYSTSATGYADSNYSTATYMEGNYTFTIPAEEFNGFYYVWAIDDVGHASETPSSIVVKIDKTAPAEISMKYVEDTDKGWIERVINVLTFGLVFKDEIYIEVHAEDNRTDQDSGLWKYQYQMVADGQELDEDAWVDFISSNEDDEIKLDVGENENFLGKVYIRAWDVAGNYSTAYTHTENGDEMIIVKDNGTPNVPTIHLNGYTENVWTKDDVVIDVTDSVSISGIKEYQYRIHYTDGSIPDVNWTTMPESTGKQVNPSDGQSFIQDQITISADTNATYYFRAITNSDDPATPDKPSAEAAVEVKVQKTIPENATETIANANGTNDWYVGSHPKIAITEPTVSEYAAPVTTYYKLWDTNKGETEDSVQSVTFDGSNGPVITADGTYVLKIWTVDEAGNKCADSDTLIDYINVDLTAPTDLTIEIDDKSVVGGNSIAFDTFYKEPVTVKLDAKCDISGLKSLQYQKVHAVSDYNVNGQWTSYPNAGIVVNPSEKFAIYCRAEDMAGNVTIINSTGIVVDDKLPEGEINAPEIDILPAAPNANGFHNSDVNVDLAVVDPQYNGQTVSVNGDYSGLNKITYRIYTTDTDAVEEGTLLDVASGVTSGAVFDVDGLISSWSGNITVTGNTFNSNNVRVELTAVDNAGNSRTTTTAAGDIQIDMTNPTINVSYSNNDADSSTYFKADRTATIVVTERNFDPKDVVIRITNTDGVIPSLSNWTKTTGTGNQDDTRWTATITYNADGDYTFDIAYTDLADRAAAAANYGASVAPTSFTVDKTLPTITVSYDNNEAANGKYFNAPRTATVTIVEHNFDESRVTFTRTAALNSTNIDLPTISWANNGDTHTATIAYSADGDYTFDVTMLDIAGNESGTANYGNSVAAKEFTVDQTYDNGGAPVIGGVEDGQAYPGVVIPTINFTDVNYSNYEIHLYRTRKDQIHVDITDEKNIRSLITEDTQNISGELDIFPANTSGKYSVEDDGIYTLEITAYDMAGNEHPETVTFTVNRFGSVYVYDSYLISLIQGGGAYVQEVTDDLVITEYNANRLVNDSLSIEITRDGRSIEVEYVSDPVPNADVEVGESGWFQYQYTISKDNFAEDGIYHIALSSKDEANNTPESTTDNTTDAKGNPIVDTMQFRVDSTVPEITSIAGLEDRIINEQTVDVRYTAYDAIGLKSVTVYVNGTAVQTIDSFDDLNNYSNTFTITESSSEQTVRILVEDLAGNVTDSDRFGETDSDGNVIVPMPAYSFNRAVTVSTNFFVRWYANQPLFWGSIGGVVVLAGAIWFLIVFLRKKKKGDEK